MEILIVIVTLLFIATIGRKVLDIFSNHGVAPTNKPPAPVPGRLFDRKPKGSVLFLDFDGVLHPGASGTFINLPALECILREHPNVDVIISSSWRESASKDYLRSLFSMDIAERVVGITPSLLGPAQREREILSFVTENHICNWVAIDDEESLFTPGCPFLLLTDRHDGLTVEKQTDLRRIFAKWR